MAVGKSRRVDLVLYTCRYVVLPVRLHLPHARRQYVLCHKLRGDDLQLEMLIQKLILVRRRRVRH